MTDAALFERFPAFIREHIYRHGWQELREVQLQAARVILCTEDNLLLSSGTASGKTEAAFFPILTDLCEKSQRAGIAVLYIAPLKSLINDQFYRMEGLLEESGIPVFHWHGDAAASHKAKLLRDPRGILQITPESLESILIHRSNDIPRLFGNLQYIVIDEVHAMIGSDRGNQVICQLSRLQRLLGTAPRRIGLSATIGDIALAGQWLGAGSGRQTATPLPAPQPLRWRLGMEHFYIGTIAGARSEEPPLLRARQGEPVSNIAGARREEPPSNTPSSAEPPPAAEPPAAPFDAGFSFLYDAVKDKKTLVFSNSREETEYVTATLRQIAAMRREEDIFYIHHGNLSAALRESAELVMKDDSVPRAVTCATVTMELGIDIGRLERVVQMGATHTVSAFLQRLGRSGRRDAPPEMLEIFREEMPLPNTPLPQLVPWELLRAIAVVELYSGYRFIEPPRLKQMPLSLAFHQTLSILAAGGEQTAAQLAQRVLSLPPLSALDKETYRHLLLSMVENDLIEMTEERGLIVGLEGERLINSFKFFAVFKDTEAYTVRCDSEEIGTITTPPPVGDRFALAGRVWEVTDADPPRKLVYVKHVEGKMPVSWPGDSGEVHTRLLERMREVLTQDKDYPYLLPGARERLRTARHLAANTGMGEKLLLRMGGDSWCLFPWLGTRAFRTLRRHLSHHAASYGISDIESEGCYYLTFKYRGESGDALLEAIADTLRREGIDKEALVGAAECPLFDKYDPYIPPELLRTAYARDRLNSSEVIFRFTGEQTDHDT
ncbi:MAG: DEAD/DEAH box helicase [Eubacteriales bacterium]